jgi:hypothetical protein
MSIKRPRYPVDAKTYKHLHDAEYHAIANVYTYSDPRFQRWVRENMQNEDHMEQMNNILEVNAHTKRPDESNKEYTEKYIERGLFNQIDFKGGSHRKRSHRKRSHSKRSHSKRKSHRNTRRRMGGDDRNLQLPPQPMSTVIQPNGPEFQVPEHHDFDTMRQLIIEHRELLPGLRQGLQNGNYIVIQGPGVANAHGQAPVGRVYRIISREEHDEMVNYMHRLLEQQRRVYEQQRVLDARRIT